MKKIILLAFSISLSACQTTYYVVRHAEKAQQPKQDPPLTPEGQQRAERLKTLLAAKNIKKTYSSDYLRTRETARPTAELLGLTIELYNPNEQAPFIEQLKASKKNTLVVGHSNTIRHIVNGLYESDTIKKDLVDTEYNNLFIIKRKKISKKQVFVNERF